VAAQSAHRRAGTRTAERLPYANCFGAVQYWTGIERRAPSMEEPQPDLVSIIVFPGTDRERDDLFATVSRNCSCTAGRVTGAGVRAPSQVRTPTPTIWPGWRCTGRLPRAPRPAWSTFPPGDRPAGG